MEESGEVAHPELPDFAIDELKPIAFDFASNPEKVEDLKDLVRKYPKLLYKKDSSRYTLLGVAIVEKNDRAVQALLELNAADSIFVEGYLADSLVCTLPQASQPPSTGCV